MSSPITDATRPWVTLIDNPTSVFQGSFPEITQRINALKNFLLTCPNPIWVYTGSNPLAPYGTWQSYGYDKLSHHYRIELATI